jgi:hypothetical protein
MCTIVANARARLTTTGRLGGRGGPTHEVLDAVGDEVRLGRDALGLLRNARAGLLGLALEARAGGGATALEALDLGLEATAADLQLLLDLVARAERRAEAVDGLGHGVTSDEGGADLDERGALGVLLDTIDGRLGELAARLGGLLGGGRALAGLGGLVGRTRLRGLLGGGRALGGVGLAGGGGSGGHVGSLLGLRKLDLSRCSPSAYQRTHVCKPDGRPGYRSNTGSVGAEPRIEPP